MKHKRTTIVVWIDVETALPDTDTSVLLHDPFADEPVWPGYWDSENQKWRWADGTEAHPHRWADIPVPELKEAK